jgi:hypothetical protein
MGAALVQLLRQQPFRPFRIYLSSGITHEVKHPELAIVGALSLVLQTPSTTPLISVATREFIIAFDHIVQLEVIDPVNPAQN